MSLLALSHGLGPTPSLLANDAAVVSSIHSTLIPELMAAAGYRSLVCCCYAMWYVSEFRSTRCS